MTLTLTPRRVSSALDRVLATLHQRPSTFFSFAGDPVPSRLRKYVDILSHPDHTPASADYTLRLGLTASDQPISLVRRALLARFCPNSDQPRVLSLATLSVAELISHLNPGLAGWALEAVLIHLDPEHPLTPDDLTPFIARGACPLPATQDQTNTTAPDTIFTSAAIDLLISSPGSWPDVATFAPLSDVQFVAYLGRINFASDFDCDALGRTLTSPQRLGRALDAAITGGTSFSSSSPFWSGTLQRLITPADFDTIIPHLPVPYATAFAAARPVIFQLYPRDVTPERLAALVHLDPNHLFHDLVTTTAPSVPNWLQARLALRVPGLANVVLNTDSIFTSNPHTSRVQANAVWAAFRITHLLRFFAITEAAARSLLSPGATLAQVLTALKVLEAA